MIPVAGVAASDGIAWVLVAEGAEVGSTGTTGLAGGGGGPKRSSRSDALILGTGAGRGGREDSEGGRGDENSCN